MQHAAHRGGHRELLDERVPGAVDDNRRPPVLVEHAEQRGRGIAGVGEPGGDHGLRLLLQDQELLALFLLAEGEPHRQVHDQDGDGHREDDHRAELGPDRGKAVQRTRRSTRGGSMVPAHDPSSRNAYPTPWTVRM